MGLLALLTRIVPRDGKRKLKSRLEAAPLAPSRLEPRRMLDASGVALMLGPVGELCETVQAGEYELLSPMPSANTSVSFATPPAADVSLSLVSPISENDILALTIENLDPTQHQFESVVIDWGDASLPETIALDNSKLTATLFHQYLDDNPTGTPSDTYTIELLLTDIAGDLWSAQTSVAVDNVAPTLDSLTVSTPIDENGTAILSGTFSDPGTLDTFQLDIDWNGDLTFDETITVAGGKFTATHQFLDDDPTGTPSDTFDVNVRLRDDDLGTDTASIALTINNVAPQLTLDPVPEIDENGMTVLSGIIQDVGTRDTFTLELNWGDPLSPNNSQTFLLGNTSLVDSADGINWDPVTRRFSVAHRYLDDNPTATPGAVYVITSRVVDDDTGEHTIVTSVDVQNENPVVALDAVPDIFEHGTAILTGSYTDDSLLDSHRLTIDWDDPNNALDSLFQLPAAFVFDPSGGVLTPNLAVGQTFSSLTPGDASTVLRVTQIDTRTGEVRFTASHQYLDDGVAGTPSGGANGTPDDTSTIRVTVEDDDTGIGVGTTTVRVQNLDPVIDSLSVTPDSILESQSVTLTGTFTDVGTRDFHTAEVRWGDGHRETIALVEAGGTGLFTATHVYADNDTVNPDDAFPDNRYSIVIVVHDDDSGFFSRTIDVTVLNVSPTLEPIVEATDVNTKGETFLTIKFFDPGEEPLTVWVDWGDIRDPNDPSLPGADPFVEEITIVGPGVFTITRKHTYSGPPNPLSPASDIVINVFVRDDDFANRLTVDDDGQSVIRTVAISNPGEGTDPVRIDTTPQVPRLVFPPRVENSTFFEASTPAENTRSSGALRSATGDVNATTDRFLELRVIDSAGNSSEGFRLKPEVLNNLPSLFRSLPDNHYAIYLVRLETNTRRLVIEVFLRNGKVIDPGDDSEGTRDRPPTDHSPSTTNETTFPSKQKTETQQKPDEPDQPISTTPAANVSDPLAPREGEQAVPLRLRGRCVSPSLVLALGLAASPSAKSWAERIDQTVASARRWQWQQLRRRNNRFRGKNR